MRLATPYTLTLGLSLAMATSAFSAPLPLRGGGATASASINALVTLDNSMSMIEEMNVDFKYPIIDYLKHDNIIHQGHSFSMKAKPSSLTLKHCGPEGNYLYIWGSEDYEKGIIGDPDECLFLRVIDQPKLFDIEWRWISHDSNSLYYDPSRIYEPWPGYPAADFNAARENPMAGDPDYDNIRDLGTSDSGMPTPGITFAVWIDSAGWEGRNLLPDGYSAGPNGDKDIWDNHILYNVRSNSRSKTLVTFSPDKSKLSPANIGSCGFTGNNPFAGYQSCFGRKEKNEPWNNREFGRTLKQEQQNIANWYQYHRNREFESKYAVSKIILDLPDVNFGFTTLGDLSDKRSFVPVRSSDDNAATHQTDIIDAVQTTSMGVPTFLGKSLLFGGDYFQGSVSGHDSPIESSCDQNFHIIVTDGLRNNDWSVTRAGMVDHDGDGYRFVDDNRAISLADISSYFYQTDLAPSIANKSVQADAICKGAPSVSHQGLRTIGLSYGVFPEPTDATGCWPEGGLTESSDWKDPFPRSGGMSSQNSHRDLWHAAYNSNGYFSYFKDASAMLEKLKTYFGSIEVESQQFGSMAVSNGKIDGDSMVFTSFFDIGINQGELKGQTLVESNDSLATKVKWSVGAGVTHKRANDIVTYNPSTKKGVRLKERGNPTNIFTDEQFLRLFPSQASGDKATLINDFAAGLYAEPLGPSPNSKLMFVGDPNGKAQLGREGINTDVFGGSYQDFLVNTKRRPLIYIASNDGMLHGFDADSGRAYVTYLPDMVLSDRYAGRSNGASQPFLDGNFAVADVFFEDAKKWKTVLISGMRLGGQGVFALDITDPDAFGPESALWEFSDKDDIDVGFTYGKPAIGRFNTGRWLAVFPGGYNNIGTEFGDTQVSTTGNAVLYIVDIETGALVRKLDTGMGMAQDPAGTDRPNGLWEPSLIDVDGDTIIDKLYVGDFFGNVFAFDLSNANPSQWSSAYGGNTPTPFIASRVLNDTPITTKPIVTREPITDDLLVIIGTGEEITAGSAYNPSVLIGAYDRGSPITNKGDLGEVQLQRTNNGWSLKEANSQKPGGWMIQLSGASDGLQVTLQPKLISGELIWALTDPNTSGNTTPSTGGCTSVKGTSHLLVMNPYNGESLNKLIFSEQAEESTQNDGIMLGEKLFSFDIIRTSEGEFFVGSSPETANLFVEKEPATGIIGRQGFRDL